MRVYASTTIPGHNNQLYLEHWLNGMFTGKRTRCYHYDLPDDEATALIRLGMVKPIPKGRKFPCVKDSGPGQTEHVTH